MEIEEIVEETQIYVNRFDADKIKEKRTQILRSFSPIKIHLDTISPFCVELNGEFYSLKESSLIFTPQRIKTEISNLKKNTPNALQYTNTLKWFEHVIDLIIKNNE